MTISKYSFGIGDRFAHEGVNQLKALIKAEEKFGVHFTPVWNKSNREHTIIGTEPMSTRQEADAAVKALGYKDQYFCDADHINMNNVDKFIEACDFFTIDVADYIGKSGSLEERYLPAVREAGKIYRHIAEKKGADNFVTEVSMDEVDVAQTPEEIKYILTELAKEKVPLQTFAPKFTGRFNKGVDYVGDLAQFEKEFEEDLKVIAWAVKELGLPANLKLSIHSGSDKFSIYPIMGRLIRKYDAGIHVKTAGTTWLEEIIGLSLADPAALALAKKIYRNALTRMDELTVPYATVIDVDKSKLPAPEVVDAWDAQTFAKTLRHDEVEPLYNPSFRQLIHVSFKVAAELKDEYIPALERSADVIGREIEANIGERHVKLLFS
ncbi:MAG: tagaturonate epimerase family protein [Kiritimatiellae bacterium]|nr:tagaturonate epimerase family protein [Kiritimatiellia bacterium]